MQEIKDIIENTVQAVAITKPTANLPTKLPEGHGQKLVESLLNLREVNWYEISYGNNIKPIPLVRRDSLEFELISNEIKRLESRPIARDELAGLLFRLQGHYWTANKPEALHKSVTADYIRILLPKNFELADVEAAYDRWLINPENVFFPQVGQLISCIEVCKATRTWRLHRLKKLRDKAT